MYAIVSGRLLLVTVFCFLLAIINGLNPLFNEWLTPVFDEVLLPLSELPSLLCLLVEGLSLLLGLLFKGPFLIKGLEALVGCLRLGDAYLMCLTVVTSLVISCILWITWAIVILSWFHRISRINMLIRERQDSFDEVVRQIFLILRILISLFFLNCISLWDLFLTVITLGPEIFNFFVTNFYK